MPVSKKRKKKGKPVGPGKDRPSGLTLQDLINVVAYQEHVKNGTIVAEDAVVNVPDVIPVMVGEDENKREVGTATVIPGDEKHLSINITDPEILAQIQESRGDYSIDKENEDGGN